MYAFEDFNIVTAAMRQAMTGYQSQLLKGKIRESQMCTLHTRKDRIQRNDSFQGLG